MQNALAGAGPVPHGRCFVVTQERFLDHFRLDSGRHDGSGGSFRRFAWCDQENPGAWDYSNVTSQAGFLDIEPASPIICATATRTGTMLLDRQEVPTSASFSARPTSTITSSSRTTARPGRRSRSVDHGGLVAMDDRAGRVRLRRHVDDADRLQGPAVDRRRHRPARTCASQACAMHVGKFNECWWFFPQNGQPYQHSSGNLQLQRRMVGPGAHGALGWHHGELYTAHPIMADGIVAFQHEVGNVYPTRLPSCRGPRRSTSISARARG